MQNGLQELDVGGDATDAELREGTARTQHGGLVVAAAARELHERLDFTVDWMVDLNILDTTSIIDNC